MKLIPHGTDNGYSNYGCRCDLCKAARAAARKGRQGAVPENAVHGKRSTYQACGCRCDLCRAAERAYNQKRIEAKPELREQANQRQRRWVERNPEASAANCQRWRERNPEKVKEQQKRRNEEFRLRQYQLTTDQHEAMIAAQNGVCAICGQPDKTRLAVDHCHQTRRLRGMLCRPCNLGLGCFKDDVERLKKAIDYLENDRCPQRSCLIGSRIAILKVWLP
jgi:hypothetical protein